MALVCPVTAPGPGLHEDCAMRVACKSLLSLALLAWPLAGLPPAFPQTPKAGRQSHPIPPPEARVDINHASLDELLKVPGMTATWAARIIRFRPYRTKQDLLDRGVLSGEIFDRIKDYVIAHRDKQ